MNLTPKQRTAVETHGRALLVEAGAGTGKTMVLVARFLDLLETNPDWPLESILAITFTKKAAREMRARIRREIEEKALEAAPGSRWQTFRRNLERLQVSTIHGLCAHILRENALAAGLDPRFEVIEEEETTFLKEEALRQALSALEEDKDPALELLASLQVRDLRAELEALLAKRGTVQRLFEELPAGEALLAHWCTGVAEMQQALWQAQRRAHPGLETVIDAFRFMDLAPPEDALYETTIQAQEGCRRYLAGDLVGAGQCWLDINLRGGKRDNWGGAEALAALKEDLKTLRAVAQVLEKAGGLQEVGLADEAAAAALQHWAALWQRLTGTYARLKEERHALDFDDLELHTAKLLQTLPYAPRLEGYLAGLNHCMVDEFQDTNPLQKEIVAALAPIQTPGKLFVVGDAKQSIYRFRQAQVGVFNETAAEIEAATGEPAMPLDTSFRTHATLVEAVNALFEAVLAPLGETYTSYEARPGRLQAARSSLPSHPVASAPVELVLVPQKDAAGASVNAEEGRLWEAHLLAERLLALQREAFPVWDRKDERYRPFEYRDAAILFRATTQLPRYEEVFKAAGLPYLTVSGRGYYDRPEVRDLLALLAGLANPADELNLAATLRSPLFHLNDETLYRLRRHTQEGNIGQKPRPYREALFLPAPNGQVEEVARAAAIFQELWGLVGRIGVWELLRRAIQLTGYEAALAGDDEENGRQHSNLLKFMAFARDQGGPSLSAFLRRVQDLQAREAREGEALGQEPESGAVQLMSIHAAKGLEFPVVAVADMGRGQGRGGSSPTVLHDAWFGLVCKARDENGDWQAPASYQWGKWVAGQMDEAESKRLFYVACTRAADLLILSGRAGEKKSWLQAALDGWELAVEGDADEFIERERYSLRVIRPKNRPDERRARRSTPASNPGLTIMPALAKPLPPDPVLLPMAVTRWAQDLSAETGPEKPVSPVGRPRTGVPGNILGDVIHRTLADWEGWSSGEGDLEARLAADFRRGGLVENQRIETGVGLTRQLLAGLRRHPLFQEIEQARVRYPEVPFTLETSQGVLHGVIDLLYQDAAGSWHLVDWKTEWAPTEELEEAAQQYMLQLAVYARAASQALGVRPQATLCFLRPHVQIHKVTEEELEIAWRRVLPENSGERSKSEEIKKG